MKLPMRARQYIVDMCAETQNPSKLFDSTDDKLTVSGMHKKQSDFKFNKQNSKHKGLFIHVKTNE